MARPSRRTSPPPRGEDGPPGESGGPQRQCAACRRRAPARRLLRFAVGPRHELVVDPYRRLPGRGAHTCAAPACIRDAVARGALARTLKEPAHGNPDHLMAAAAGSLRERALQLLGLARRGARLRAGADDAERAIGSGSARLLVVAADASDRTAREFSQAARLRGIPVVEAFTRQALGLATGRPDTAVMAVEDAEMASDLQFWLGAATRLESGGRPEPPRQDPRPAVETKDGGA